MSKSLLNLDQTPAELQQVYDTGYYWYLDSEPFHRAFIGPLGDTVNRLGQPVLDVGCGVGYLRKYVTTPYVGLDGSVSAIRKAKEKYSAAAFYLGRFEDPQTPDDPQFGTVVFGGIFSVLVRPDRYLDLIELYRARYPTLRYLVIYDLELLNTTAFDAAYQRLSSYHATAHGMPADFQEVKKHRKILVYDLQERA